MKEKRLKEMPIGIEDFKELVDEDRYYFVDKTMMLKELIDDGSKVKLFTRPRRFGKTLNMSMMQYFFEDTSIEHEHAKLFDGLKISEYPEYMEKHQGQYPVINVSFKEMKDDTYEFVFDTYKEIMQKEFERHKDYIYNADVLLPANKRLYDEFLNSQASESSYRSALQFLSECMEKAYKKKVIILIDEYDVPLEAAYMNGFYPKMVSLIRRVFSSALKSNDALHKGILTGCLRISKESIFTGFNNLDIFSILSPHFTDSFGFTQSEIDTMLEYYGISDRDEELKEWYDGYWFWKTDIYNPWSVINYVKNITKDPYYGCDSYWSNTSSNSIVKSMIEDANEEVKAVIERLTNGETIESKISENITYQSINQNVENIWSFLLFTGYLKVERVKKRQRKTFYDLKIPNEEIKSIYEDTIYEWFKKQVQSENRDEFFKAVLNKDAEKINEYLSYWLRTTISYYDERENYYHGFLAGLLTGFSGYSVKSNRESGDGRYDIFVLDDIEQSKAIIFEFKIADSKRNLQKAADDAVIQIKEKNYVQELKDDEYDEIISYGIAFYRKICYTKLSEYSD